MTVHIVNVALAGQYFISRTSIGYRLNMNSSGDEIANVNFLRRYGTYVLQNTKKREPTSFNQLDDS